MNAISNILKAADVAGARTDELDAIKENGVTRIAMIGDNPLRACRPFERLRFILGVQLADTLLGHGGGGAPGLTSSVFFRGSEGVF